MTLPLNSRLSALYDTNGTQKDFSFGFRVFFDPDNGGYGLEVRRQTADGYEVIPKSDYLVLPVEDNSAGVVRFSVAPSAGQQIYIAGKTPTIQQLVLTNFGRYSAESIETQFDFITAIIQEWLSALDEETRQRIAADDILTQYVVNRIDAFVQEVNQNWDDKSQEIEDYIASIMPSFTQTLREEIEAFAVAGMQDAIDQTLADSKAEIDDAVSRANAAATAAAITVKLYDTPEAGVDPVTGVADGAYFNVRSSSDESYVDEYQNIGGVPTPSGKSYPSGAALAEVIETAEKVNSKIQRENVSVWDFFTDAELSAYKAAPTTFDAARPINEFFEYISANDVGTAYCSGSFSIGSTIYIGNNNIQRTKLVEGRLVLKDIVGLDAMVIPKTGGEFKFGGYINVTGYFTGSAWSYVNRKTRIGIHFPPSGSNGRNTFGTIRGQYFRQALVYCDNNTTLTKFERIHAGGIGTGYQSNQYRVPYTSVTNTGSSGSTAQLSIITVDTLPEADIDCQKYIVIDGNAHLITGINYEDKTISVYPWVVGNTSGSLEYVWGAGLDVRGGDSSIVHADILDVLNSAIGLACRALYYPSVSDCCIQNTRFGITIGSSLVSAGSGGYIGNYYTENMLFDLVFVTHYGSDGRLPILSSYETRIDKTAFIGARTTDGTYAAFGNTATGFQYNFKGYNYFCESAFQSYKADSSDNTIPTDLFSQNLYRQLYNKNVSIFKFSSFTAQNVAKARLFGLSTGLIHVMGTGANGSPTTVTFSRSSTADYTINGGMDDVIFTDFDGVAEFVIYIEVRAKNYIVRRVGAVSSRASVTYDPPSLANGIQQSTTVTLTGAKLGDNINVSFDKPLSGTRMWGEVTSANTVTVYHRNDTGAVVDVASGTLKVKLV